MQRSAGAVTPKRVRQHLGNLNRKPLSIEILKRMKEASLIAFLETESMEGNAKLLGGVIERPMEK